MSNDKDVALLVTAAQAVVNWDNSVDGYNLAALGELPQLIEALRHYIPAAADATMEDTHNGSTRIP